MSRQQSVEERQKRSETMRRLWSDPAFREKTIAGHSREEARRKMCPIGRRHPEETKRKISLAHKGRKWSEEHNRKMGLTKIRNKNCVGRVISNETRRRISEANSGRTVSEEIRRKLSEVLIGNKRALGMKHSEKTRRRMSEVHKGRTFSLSHRQKIGQANRRRWANEAVKTKIIRKMFKSLAAKPNKQERLLGQILDELFLGQYKFVGDFSFSLGGKSPDFLNVNGQKKLIELFGDYWHKGENEDDRVSHFQRYGFDTLVVWERELKDRDSLVKRLVAFQDSGSDGSVFLS